MKCPGILKSSQVITLELRNIEINISSKIMKNCLVNQNLSNNSSFVLLEYLIEQPFYCHAMHKLSFW